MNGRCFAIIIVIMIVCNPSFSTTTENRPSKIQSSFNSSSLPHVVATNLAEEIYHQASEVSFLNFIQDLTSFGPRPYLSEENDLAREWLISTLLNISENRLEVEVRGTTNNVIARLPGTIQNDVCFMIGGHYDTVEEAPGANDDGTGVATTLELARILSQYTWPLDIYFCFWNAEELGLIGSSQMASQFFSDEIDILVYFNIDMLLVQNNYAMPDERILLYYTADYGTPTIATHYTIYQDSQYWADTIYAMNSNYGTPIIKPKPHYSTYIWPHSDHYSFFIEGYKSAMFFFESGFNYDTAYHSAEDTWDNPLYDYSLTTPVVASIGATIAFAQSRTIGQGFIERYSLIIGPYGSNQIFFQSTLETEVSVNATSDMGNNLEFDGLSPSRAVLATSSPDIMNMNNEPVLSFTTEPKGQHSITVRNEGSSAVEVTIQFSYDSDLEGDSIPDSDQEWYNRFDVDSDLDSLNDMYEMERGINRFDPDTDHDTIWDYDEIGIYGTSPISNDSDSDSMPDAWEILNDLDPINREDRFNDPDNDLLTNVDEYRAGTLPRLNDTDFDKLLDGLEVKTYHTSPLTNDTDMDQMDDFWEIQNGLDPLVDDSMLDPDEDGKTNLDEYILGEDPHLNTMTTTQTEQATQNLNVVIIGGSGIIVASIILVVFRLRNKEN